MKLAPGSIHSEPSTEPYADPIHEAVTQTLDGMCSNDVIMQAFKLGLLDSGSVYEAISQELYQHLYSELELGSDE